MPRRKSAGSTATSNRICGAIWIIGHGARTLRPALPGRSAPRPRARPRDAPVATFQTDHRPRRPDEPSCIKLDKPAADFATALVVARHRRRRHPRRETRSIQAQSARRGIDACHPGGLDGLGRQRLRHRNPSAAVLRAPPCQPLAGLASQSRPRTDSLAGEAIGLGSSAHAPLPQGHPRVAGC